MNDIMNDIYEPTYPDYIYPAYDAIFNRTSPKDAVRFIASPCGRGVGRTTSFCKMLVELALTRRSNIGVFRDTHKSLQESCWTILVDEIREQGLEGTHFTIIESRSLILCNTTGSRIKMFGIQAHTATRDKGRAKYDVVFFDEASETPAVVMEKFVPTNRGGWWHPLTLIIFAWNPENDDDPVQEMFVNNNPPPRTIIIRAQLDDNPFASQSNIEQRAIDMRDRPSLARHIWFGETRRVAELAVFENFRYELKNENLDDLVHEMKIIPKIGADWGYVHPTACVQLYIIKHKKIIFWAHESGDSRLQTHEWAALLAGDPTSPRHLWKNPSEYKGVPAAKILTIKCDDSQPQTIALMKKLGLKTEKAGKWPGFVEDSNNYFRDFTHVISKRCPKTYDNFRKYQYKEDPQTGKPKGDKAEHIEKLHDDFIDAGKYACRDEIKHHAKQHASTAYSGGWLTNEILNDIQDEPRTKAEEAVALAKRNAPDPDSELAYIGGFNL